MLGLGGIHVDTPTRRGCVGRGAIGRLPDGDGGQGRPGRRAAPAAHHLRTGQGLPVVDRQGRPWRGQVLRPGGAFLVYQFSPKCRDFFAPYLLRYDPCDGVVERAAGVRARRCALVEGDPLVGIPHFDDARNSLGRKQRATGFRRERKVLPSALITDSLMRIRNDPEKSGLARNVLRFARRISWG